MVKGMTRQKFVENTELKEKLINTSGFELIERSFIQTRMHGAMNRTPNIVNKFFATIGESVSKQIDSVYFTQLDNRVDISFNQFTQMTERESLDIVTEFSLNKSTGINDLCSKLIFDAIESILGVFRKIMQ